MIFLRTTLRELTAAGVAVFVVLLAITFTSQLIRLLGYAARGRIPPDAVATLKQVYTDWCRIYPALKGVGATEPVPVA